MHQKITRWTLEAPRATRALSRVTRSLPPSQLPLFLHEQQRHSSQSSMTSDMPKPRKKVTLQTLQCLHKKNEPITMVTAHDFPSAHVADHAGMDMVLVGDSLAMVALGMDDTTELTLEDMIVHCRSVSRATKTSFIVSFGAL